MEQNKQQKSFKKVVGEEYFSKPFTKEELELIEKQSQEDMERKDIF